MTISRIVSIFGKVRSGHCELVICTFRVMLRFLSFTSLHHVNIHKTRQSVSQHSLVILSECLYSEE